MRNIEANCAPACGSHPLQNPTDAAADIHDDAVIVDERQYQVRRIFATRGVEPTPAPKATQNCIASVAFRTTS